jgi:hypothetical protein
VSLFEKVKAKHGERVAKERLETSTGFRSVSRVKDEKISAGLDGMLAVLELPPQK